MQLVQQPQVNALKTSDIEQENPLIWPLLSLLKKTEHSWKIHYLATQLKAQGLLMALDQDPDQDLFKRNFLLMNALFQLQQMLLPKQWLQVHAMEIKIFSHLPSDLSLAIQTDQGLREYYLNWDNYQVSGDYIREMLEQFWNRYQQHIGASTATPLDNGARLTALTVFELTSDPSKADIRKQWRRLALRWHPDRPNGNAAKFRTICEAWHVLRC